MATTLSHRQRLRDSIAPFMTFYGGLFARWNRDPQVANFAVGNPQEMPLAGYVNALRRHVEPLDKDWFAYKVSEPASQRAVADTLRSRMGVDWDPADVAMTNGGFGALATAMRALLEPGDEVIFLSPPWFFYEQLILAVGGEPVRVRLVPPAFDVDLAALEAAIGPRTRAVLVNSPHNPSGRVYPPEVWRELADLLEGAGERIGHPISLVSDEPYNRIVFDGRQFRSPAEVYPRTLIAYSYGKTLLAPGQRIGYLSWPPTMPDREELRDMVLTAQLATGFAFPNALLQHAIADLEGLSIDIGALQRRRDRLVSTLREIGYETTWPEGTFYVMARAPITDDLAFAESLAGHGALVLPGSIVEVPGWFRISLTASDEMIERGITAFRKAFEEAVAGVS